MMPGFGFGFGHADPVSGGGGGPTPFVSIDFKNGTYLINGTAKTLAEVCEDNEPLIGTAFDPDNVVEGVGFKVVADGDPVDTNQAPVLTAEALAALGTEFVFVVAYSFSPRTAVPNTQMRVKFEFTDWTVYSTEWGFSSVVTTDGAGDSGVNSTSVFDFGVAQSPEVSIADGAHKVAAIFSADELALSVDGDSVNSAGTPQTLTDTPIFIIFVTSATTGSPTDVTIEKVQFFSLDDYSVIDLPALST
jgi:hypothetical protein